MYLSHHKGKSVVTDRFIRTLENKIQKYLTSLIKNVGIHKLADRVNEYNNVYHSTIKLKPADVNSNIYIDIATQNSSKNRKFECDDRVRISKYKNTFEKGFAPN